MEIPATAALLLALAGAVHARGADTDRSDLLRAEAAACHAFEVGDAGYLREALDPAFTLVDSRGGVSDLDRNLVDVEKREPAYEVFRNHDQQVRIYGDTAVIVGITSIRYRDGEETVATDFRYTDTWLRRDGRWVLAASHASRLPAQP